MRALGVVVLAFAVLASAQLTVSPAWEKAVQDAKANLNTREADVSRLHGQCQAARGTLHAKRTAHEESQQSEVAKKVLVTQAQARLRSAIAARDVAKGTRDAFHTGPFTTAQTAWQAQLKQKPDLEQKQQRISLARQDLARDFPTEAQSNAKRDLDQLQIDVTRRVTAFNNAKVAYDAAVLTLNQHNTNLKAAQLSVNEKQTGLSQAKTALAAAVTLRQSRLTERRSARVAYDSCVNQLTSAKQARVAAVGGLRVALETMLQNLKAVQLAAQQDETAKQATTVDRKAAVDRINALIEQLSKSIADLTRQHAEANQKLAQAIADYTVAQTQYENAKQRTARARANVAEAQRRAAAIKVPATAAPTTAPTTARKL